MSVFNGGPYLEPAVASLLNQTYYDFELVILNNGSTDDSPRILQSFDDPRLRVINREKTIPRTEALNTVLRAARGEIVAVQDADDLSLPNRLERQMAYLGNHPEVALLASWVEFIDENGAGTGLFQPPSSHQEVVEASRACNPMVHSSVMYRRSAAMAVGGYPKQYVYAQDFGLWLALMRNHKAAILPEVLVQLRQHSNQMTTAPGLRITRTREAVQLFLEAALHPEVVHRPKSPELAGAMLDHAVALSEAGRRPQAWYWVARAGLIQPHRWLRSGSQLRMALKAIVGRCGTRGGRSGGYWDHIGDSPARRAGFHLPRNQRELNAMSHEASEVQRGAELTNAESSKEFTRLISRITAQPEIIAGIPRFVQSEKYASSFGLQWNAFRRTQLDSFTGLTISRDRLTRLMGGSLDVLAGKSVLEAGCGAGRFSEVMLEAGANLFAVDLSSAVEASYENCKHYPNYYVCQADILQVPLPPEQFDIVVCVGVLQATPDPEKTISTLCSHVKPGGLLVIDHYTYGYAVTPSRRLLRGLLLKVSPRTALRFCEEMTWILWPIHRLLWSLRDHRYVARLRHLFLRISPLVDYHEAYPQLGPDLLRAWAILDTHDTVTDHFKHLRSAEELAATLQLNGMADIFTAYAGNGVEVRAIKPLKQTQGEYSASDGRT